MSASAGRPEGRVPSRGLWGVPIVILVCCAAAYFVFDSRYRRRQEECERLTAQLNEAVGYLEAGQFDKADAALAALAARLPQEPAAVRNLAICRVLAFLEPVKPEQAEPSPAPARAAVEAARKLEPRSPVPHLLAARIAEHLQDSAAAIAELRAAANLAADDPAIWYDLYGRRRVAG